ncbi:FMN reductase [Friedmanniella luteola]|uniref:FMN reductase n=1 Tax=Friedmanniella luteola TaxID=546871 RepID=A0A1H1WGN2_9ACTN|nr:NAD(P)H-dependent oxidoreductase [Friedmanniella luteola]SDS96263.1 FMN reductase [Friedmanniella luteola]
MTSPLDHGDARPGPSAGVVALAGNPRPGSRTLLVARTVADQLARRLGAAAPPTALDVAEVAGELFAADAPEADRYRATLAAAAVAVVATPVYKASYTGLLKAFLDRVPTGGLRGVVAVPVVVSGTPAHSFVAEHLLAPLLVELGALVPVRPLAVTESQLDDLDAVVGAWADEAAPVLARLVPGQGVAR